MLMARANFRRAKGQTAAIALLVLLAAFMLNLWLMLATDYKQNFDRYHDKLNGEHVTLVMNDDREEVREFLAKTLGEDDRVTEYCMDDAFFMVGSFVYHQGEVNTELVILEKETALNRSGERRVPSHALRVRRPDPHGGDHRPHHREPDEGLSGVRLFEQCHGGFPQLLHERGDVHGGPV